MDYPLLDIIGLSTVFNTDDGVIRAVDDVSFSISRGQTLGIVGESGCGKSVTGLSILQLQSPGQIEKGQIHYYKNNEDLPINIAQLAPRSEEMRSIRGNDIAMIFQEPMTSLNPVYTIGNQISEAVILHQRVSKQEARNRSIEMLDRVGIPAPHKRVDDYPHQLSGGMRQRAMIAMALSCNPSLLIADEPTTALDVTIQAQVLDLMRELQEELGMAIMMIINRYNIFTNVQGIGPIDIVRVNIKTGQVDFYDAKSDRERSHKKRAFTEIQKRLGVKHIYVNLRKKTFRYKEIKK